MARAKAQFNRPPDWPESLRPDQSQELQQILRTFHPKHDDQSLADEPFGHPADTFANALMREVFSAQGWLVWDRESLGKEAIFAELRTLKTKLNASAATLKKYPGHERTKQKLATVSEILRHISRDVDLLLGADTDVRACADTIDETILGELHSDCLRTIDKLSNEISQVESLLNNPPRKSPATFVPTELALLVIRVFENAELPTSSTVDGVGFAKQTSPLVLCLCAIGDYLGLNLSEKTWSGYVQSAVKNGARQTEESPKGRKQHPKKGVAKDQNNAGTLILGWGVRKK